jgi:virginiamycin B lyase
MKHPLRDLIFLLFLTMTAATAAAPDIEVTIKEYEVPWSQTRPRDPIVDAKGQIWFVGQQGHYVGRLDPATGKFSRYELEPGTGPHNVIVDESGMLWYSGNQAAHIGKMDPETGKVTKYPMPDPAAKDPHTLMFDRKGDLWFTVQGGNFVGKLEPKTGKVHLLALPTPKARPYGIALDSKGRVWFNEFGTNKIGMVDVATMEMKEYPLPNPQTRGRRIAITSDDRVWYVDHARGYIGVLDPTTREVREWAAPAGANARPYAMTVDDQDRLWFAETGSEPNRLVVFDPKTERFVSAKEIGSGGGAVRHMVFHKPTRSIWFGTDKGTIGRASAP